MCAHVSPPLRPSAEPSSRAYGRIGAVKIVCVDKCCSCLFFRAESFVFGLGIVFHLAGRFYCSSSCVLLSRPLLDNRERTVGRSLTAKIIGIMYFSLKQPPVPYNVAPARPVLPATTPF